MTRIRLHLKRTGAILALAFCFAAIAPAQESKVVQREEATEKSEPIGWKWANFVLLAIGLGYLIGKSVPAAFRARTVEIQKGISEAQIVKQDAEKRAAEVDARIRGLGAEIERIRTESKAEMQQESERIRQETARQIARLEAQAQQEIESAGKVARRDLKNYAASLALDLAEQRVRARMDGTAEAGLVDGFLKDLGSQESRN